VAGNRVAQGAKLEDIRMQRPAAVDHSDLSSCRFFQIAPQRWDQQPGDRGRLRACLLLAPAVVPQMPDSQAAGMRTPAARAVSRMVRPGTQAACSFEPRKFIE
jgi:hypothetical protein